MKHPEALKSTALRLEQVSVSFEEGAARRSVLDRLDFALEEGAIGCLLGASGSGKTTVLRTIAGFQPIDHGKILIRDAQVSTPSLTVPPERRKVGIVFQDYALFPHLNVIQNVGFGLRGLSREAAHMQCLDLLELVGLAELATRYPHELSGGQQQRVALARALAPRPHLLLLDEPTNHLDAESVDWLERFLQEYSGTVIAITHDRYFLDNVAKWILELDRGRGIPFSGNYSSWLEQKEERLAREEKSNDARRRTLQRELEWVRMAPKARQAKGKARLSAYEKLHAEAQAAERGPDKLEITIPAGKRLGDTVIKVENLSKGYGDRLLIENLSFSLPPAGIVGIIGANGAGKTTLFRMLTGQEPPDSGTVTVGDTVQLSYVDQSRDSLNADNTVYEEITGGADTLKVGGREIHGRAYVASFNFKGSDQQKKVGELSGGERNRVHLAKLLKSGGNVLLLDEPTNDLDVDTLRALESALEAFPGCAVVISHDRWFLDRIATHVLAFEGNSQVRWFEGNFQDYEAWRRKELGVDAEQPKRLRYKPLVRK